MSNDPTGKIFHEEAYEQKSIAHEIESPAIAKFFYLLMVVNFLLGIIGVIAAFNSDYESNKQIGVYVAIAGICAGFSCMVSAVFFTMLNELIHHSRSVHEILRKKNN